MTLVYQTVFSPSIEVSWLYTIYHPCIYTPRRTCVQYRPFFRCSDDGQERSDSSAILDKRKNWTRRAKADASTRFTPLRRAIAFTCSINADGLDRRALLMTVTAKRLCFPPRHAP